MNNSKLERLLNVTHSARDARESLKQVVPAIRTGININTHLGNLTLNGEDAVGRIWSGNRDCPSSIRPGGN